MKVSPDEASRRQANAGAGEAPGRTRPAGARAPTALVGAMVEELEALLDAVEDPRRERLGPFEVTSGVLEGQPVLLAHCGIGKVNAAALTQALLARGAVRLIFTGVAGAVRPGLRVGDLVVSSDAVQHDVDVTALGYEPGRVPGEPLAWQADAGLRRLALEAAAELAGVQAVDGRVASGDQFVADVARVRVLRERFGADCAEMEGAAVAQVCARWGVPFVIIRSISDTADQDAHVDFRSFTPLAAARAKRVVRGILRRL
ncbi:MAG TPA: 5'-methylthioadenosine/adenosylhomocysteine nucleosidase [Trueperaceae bacterium]|nr:5'-methylthioadenosine/adenosylhomocysteine nucleosidase [Trueperaceae bacterium]